MGALGPLDGDNRASLGKLLPALGWDTTTPLVAVIDGHTAVVRVGKRTRRAPWLIAVRATGGRMTLPPPVTGALGIAPGEQVIAIALPDRGELRLLAAADGLQELTGHLDALPTAEPAAQTGRGAPVPVKTRVRAAYGHTR